LSRRSSQKDRSANVSSLISCVAASSAIIRRQASEERTWDGPKWRAANVLLPDPTGRTGSRARQAG
jgi:hypothetical protein